MRLWRHARQGNPCSLLLLLLRAARHRTVHINWEWMSKYPLFDTPKARDLSGECNTTLTCFKSLAGVATCNLKVTKVCCAAARAMLSSCVPIFRFLFFFCVLSIVSVPTSFSARVSRVGVCAQSRESTRWSWLKVTDPIMRRSRRTGAWR